MGKYIVNGLHKLEGKLQIQGSKNAALPILAATLLSPQSVVHNCPNLSDVVAAQNILTGLGCHCKRENDCLCVTPRGETHYEIPDELMREMRSSIVFLGAMIARGGRARISYPGGCELGPRPIDMHLAGLRRLGVTIEEDHGCLDCYAKNGLHGAQIALPFPSVGATENIMIAASVAQGETEIHNAAREPEITALAEFLGACGANIHMDGTGIIYIKGVKQLHACEYRVIPDRIVAATYLIAAALTYSHLLLEDVQPQHLTACLPMFEEAGCRLKCEGSSIEIYPAQGRLQPLHCVRTMPYPGFPTDAQAPFMAMCCLAEGTSVFVENIFENRYRHAEELARMGAHIKVEGRVAVVEGTPKLHGACVHCTDLRGGAALVLAALAAEGETQIYDIRHVERGYELIEEKLSSIGADIKRVENDDDV